MFIQNTMIKNFVSKLKSMNLSSQILLENIEGHWLSHMTIYYLKNKKIKINKFEKQIDKIKDIAINHRYLCKYTSFSDKKIVYNYVPEKNINSKFGILQKIYNGNIQDYKYEVKYSNNFKISHVKKDIQYTEYTYIINTNFKISIIIIKRFDRYIAICFNSEVKIIQ